MDYLLEFYQSPLTKTKFVCSTKSWQEIKNLTKTECADPYFYKKIEHKNKIKTVSQHTSQYTLH